MKRNLIFLFFLISLMAFSQSKMRTVEELINKEDSGWLIVKEWIDSAKNQVTILPANVDKAEKALFNTQITTRSPMGAVIYMTGGILVDHGWIRILGSGSEVLKRSLPEWNKGKAFKNCGEQSPFILIADDAVGGFFLVNGGGLGNDLGKVYYLAPDSLQFEPLDLSYTDFLSFCFNGNLEEFYKDLRWKNWKQDVEKIKGDQVFNFYPYLWTKEGKDINVVSKKVISVEEQYFFNMDIRKQLGIDK